MIKRRKKIFIPEKKQKTFIAFNIPDWLRARLNSIQDELRLKNFSVVWEKPEKFHITLAYLGRITENEYKVVDEVLKDICSKVAPVRLKVGYLDYLFQKHDKGLIWMGVDGGKHLVSFHKLLVKSLNSQGFSISEKKIVPHITIGRLKKMKTNDQKSVLQAVTNMELPAIGEYTAEGVSVMFSRYNREHKTSEYKLFKNIELSGYLTS